MMKIVVQTDNQWKRVTDVCLSTWCDEADRQSYELVVKDYRDEQLNFINLLLKEMENENSQTVIIGYDDLFFERFELPKASELEAFMFNNDLDGLRLDGRVPGRGKQLGTLNGLNYFFDSGSYQNSTVFSAFTVRYLMQLKELGCQSAWDIERTVIESARIAAPKVRTMKYDNLIVKGVLDHCMILNKPNISLSISLSLKRILSRRLMRLRRLFQRFEP